MTGKPLVIRPTRLETSIPEDLRAKLDLHLQSEVEGRVPKGAYQRFILDLMREFFDRGRRTKPAPPPIQFQPPTELKDILRRSAEILLAHNAEATLPARKIIAQVLQSLPSS